MDWLCPNLADGSEWLDRRAHVGWEGNTVVHLASVFLSPQLKQFPFQAGVKNPRESLQGRG